MSTLDELFGVASASIDEIEGVSTSLLDSIYGVTVSGGVSGARQVQTPQEEDVKTPTEIYLTDLGTSPDRLTVEECNHTSSSDNAVLTQLHILVIQEASHVHTVDNISLSASVTSLTTQEASHSQTVDNALLTQVHTLVAQDSLHSHVVEGDLAVDYDWTSLLRGLYYFESGNVVVDSSGRGNTLSSNAITTIIDDYKQGSASALFNGTTSYLYRLNANLSAGFPGNASTGYQNFLVTAWFKADAVGTSARDIFAKYYGSSGQRSFKVGIDTSSRLYVYMSSNGSVASVSKSFTSADTGFPNTISTEQWYHVGLYHDGDLNKWGLVLHWDDGTAHVAEYSIAYTSGVYLGTSSWGIGGSVGNTGGIVEYWNGHLDDVQVYAWADGTGLTEELIIEKIESIRGYSTSTDLTIDEALHTHLVDGDITVVSSDITLTIQDSTHALSSDNLTLTSENDFSSDSTCTALYRFEASGLTTDSKSTNTLSVGNGTPTSYTTSYKEGSGCALFVASENDYYEITDTNLVSGFPTKSGESNTSFSVCFWFRLASDTNLANYAVSKYDVTNNLRSWAIVVDCSATGNPVCLYEGLGTGGSGDTTTGQHASAIGTGKWYHVGVTYNSSDKSFCIRIWDDTAQAILGTDKTGTFGAAMAITTANFGIGGRVDSSRYFDGVIDEVVVFNRVLSTDEIDDIRNKVFGA